jgi:hypothetical protein
MNNQIPIFLIKKGNTSNLQEKLNSNSLFFIVNDALETQIAKVNDDRKKYPDIVVVFDMMDFDKESLVINSLLLRNSNYQVFISLAEDYKDLVEVIKDTHSFIKQNINEQIRTEIIVTSNALDSLGDISSIVRHFEHNYLDKHNN